jgi:hypothetical protein
MSDYIITPEQATNGTFAIKSKAHTTFDGAVQQETTDNSYGKAISNAANSVGAWVTKDPSTATVDVDAMNALAQTDVTPQQSENFVNKASEILQPAMHRAEQIYLWNKADWAQSAIDSGEKLGISADLIMASGQEGIRRAEAAAAQIERGRTIQEVREMYPELEKVNYKNSAEAITTLQNLEAINNTRGVFDAVQQGIWSMNDQIKLGQVGWKLSQTTDKSEIEDLTKEMERLQSNLKQYRQTDGTDVLQQVVGATASQGYMMAAQAIMGSNRAAEGMALGAATGAVATAWAGGEGAIPGALTGLSTGVQVGMGEQMYQMSFGTKYIELINKRDAQGNRVYTDDEARKYAMSFAAVDAGIEFASFKVFGKALSSVAPKSTMAKAIQNATSDTAQTFSRGIGTTVAQMMKANVKAGGSELVEEGLQDINEKFQHNLYRNANDPEGAYSIGDMAVGAGSAMLQALPAVIGLGAIGGGISGIHTMKAFHEFQKLTPEEQQHAIMAEQNRNGNAIMQALKQDASSNKMAKENPELYGKIVQAQGDNVGVSTAYVNVNEMAETEQGQQAIKNMIDSGLVTQEEVSKSIEANADIPVPIGKYAQLSGGLTEETVKALEESTYFTRGGMSMKTLERAKAEVEAFNNNLVDATEKKAERVKESIIRDEFEDASDVDREVLDQVFSNPTQVKQAYNNLYKNLVQEYRENYASDFDNMDNDIKEATASGVEPQWLTNYKSNNGGKSPRTNAERRRAAFHSSVAKAQTAFADNVEALNQSNIHHADMEHTLQQIESLERLHDKIFTLADNDIALRMQLSKSGYDVYNKVVKAIGESTDRKQRETAKANALLMAHHADVMAQYMRQKGKGGYTAMDYFRDSVRINMNAVLENQKGYAQQLAMHQKLQADITQWGKTLTDLQNGTLKRSVNKIMSAPLVFSTIKDPDYKFTTGDIYITTKMLNKVFATKHAHKFDLNVMKQLPGALSNPIAIFKNFDPVANASVKGEIVAVVELKDTQNNFIHVPLVFDVQSGRGGYQTRVKSIFPRVNATWYSNAINNGDLLYVNTKKINRLTVNNVQSNGQVSVNRFTINNSIPNENDLDKLRKQHNYQYYQSAWHGSPYDFDEFDLGAIGSGEGNQVHGWGLYFAKNKKVSVAYKDVLGAKGSFVILNGEKWTTDNEGDWTNGEKKVEYGSALGYVFDELEEHGTKEKAIESLQKGLDKNRYRDKYRNEAKKAIDILRKNDASGVKGGKLFKVDIPNIDTMLDEDKYFKEQNKDIINKIVSAVNDLEIDKRKALLDYYKEHPSYTTNQEYKKLLGKIQSIKQDRDYIADALTSNVNKIKEKIAREAAAEYRYNFDELKADNTFEMAKKLIGEINEKLSALEKEKEVEGAKEKIKEDKILESIGDTFTKTPYTGRDVYVALSKAFGGDKGASEFLNSTGVKGITYDGYTDGRCYVVFDDKAIKIIEKYNQSVNGMTEIMSDGERIISIFKTADRSTFLHEMGHVFFDDIQKLASMDNAPKQLLDDWNTLKEWSGWVDGENVDNTKAHEKFARGWESYLRSGEAPTKGLQRVFRQFSKWLTRIYRSVQRLGGEVPSDIKDIMARMIATQDDIENYAHEQALEQFENTKLYQQLSETEQARVQGYIADIKEKAKERVMRKYMKELDNRPIKEWEDVKDDVQVAIEKRLIEEYPIYKEHQRYLAIGDAALVNTQYGNIENLKKAEIEETGATFEDAIKQEMEHARSEFVEVNNIGKSNEQIAEEMLLSNQGQMALTEEEAKLIKQYTNKDLANNWQLLDKLQRLDPNRENLDAELAPIEKAITKAEQIKQDNAKVAKELNSTSKELDKAEDKIEKLKAQLQERINAVRAIRDGGFGTIPKYMNKARAELGDLTLAQASQYKKYQNQAIRDGKNADRALAVNKVEEALEHKQSQMMNQARARVAFENQQRIKKLRTKLLEQNARITRAKNPVMLDPQLRYFYTHMMYQMGLIKRDGLIPTDGFDETVITNRLDPDAGIAGFNTLISMDDTVSGIFNAKSPRTFATLTVNELNMLEELMTGMYHNGRREYEYNSFLTENGNPLSIDYVERDILDKAIETFGEVEESTFNIENSKTTKNAIFNKMANFVESLQQTKTILRRLDGGKGGPAEMYIYDTINRARQHFNERLESETMRLAKNVALYSRKELYKIRNERGYQVGDARNLTKEQVIALALNWGTERNRQRAIETVKANEVEIERLFQDVLDDRDWEFIIREWEQINSFYPERSAVQERMTGNPLKKEEGITFRIGGRTIEGQYYPIMYDPKTSGKSSNHEMEDIAQSFMSSNATFGYGMSATKSRLDKVKDKQLLLSLDVIPRAITESINHITMREAVTDVNTLINRKEFADYITNKLGASEYQYLRQWVRDQWTTEVSRLTEFDNMMQTIKRNISSAVMSGKVSVAIQNVANIPVAMEQLGAARVMRALYRAGVGVYGRGSGRYNETREFVLGKSVMLRERVQTLDKDMRRGLEIGGKGFTIDGKSVGGYTMEQLGEARDAINSWGYSLLSETDLMLSVPIWKDVYDVEYSKLVQKEGISLEWADQRAIELADKAIIDIFGSGDIKDQAGIQRNKGTIANFATTFYTYAGTLWNMQLDGFYAFKDRGDFKKFARVIFYDLFMQAVIMVIYNNLFGSDDDDDPTQVAKSLTKEFVNQSVMGVPFVREGITQAMNRMLGEKVYNRGTSPLSYAVIDKIDDIFTAVNSSKKDWTDVGRAGLQFANSMTGLSNTLTDGVMTIAKYGLTDIDAELEDLLYSVIFDKRLKSKKEKQKEKKQNKH